MPTPKHICTYFLILVVAAGCGLESFDASECRTVGEVTPPLSTDDGVHILAIGDTGDEGLFPLVTAMEAYIQHLPLDLALMLGDQFYPSGVSSTEDPKWQTLFEEPFSGAQWDIPFWVVPGNHDYQGNIQAQIDYGHTNDRWQMPARFYAIIEEHSTFDIQLIGIDSVDLERLWAFDATAENEQSRWLESVLSSSTAHWRLVFGHHPIFSNGKQGNRGIFDRLARLLAQHGVHVYLAGHDHDLQILKPVDDVHYIISGAGSRPRKTQCRSNSMYAAAELGAMFLSIDRRAIRVRPFIAESGIEPYEVIIEHR